MCIFFDFLLTPPMLWVTISGIGAVIVYILKEWAQGGKFEKQTDETGKVVIVTGCNTGIGKETVRELVKRGATVYMACRDMKKCEAARDEIALETNSKNIYCRELDLSSLDSIRRFVDGFKSEQQKLHVLINNAGVMWCPHALTKDGFELQLGVNHMGHFLLTNLLLDVLKQSAPGRIVNVSSRAHTRGEINVNDLNSERDYNGRKAYSQSKLANILFTRELARRLEGTNVTVNALHPGVVDTELFRHISLLNNSFTNLIFKPLLWPFIKTTKNGAQTTLFAALDPDLDKVTGKYFSDCDLKDVATAAKDTKMAKWLWTISEKWTHLDDMQKN